jgi:hypothetical protein
MFSRFSLSTAQLAGRRIFRKPGMVATSLAYARTRPSNILLLLGGFGQQVCFSNWFAGGKGGSLPAMQDGYNQFCPIAKASEIIAVRWMPLILRELMADIRTFNASTAGYH